MEWLQVSQHDLRYYLEDADVVLPEGAELNIRGPNHEGYEEALRTAFNFLRKHDDGKYSSRTKMRVLDAATNAEFRRTSGQAPAGPGVVVIETPFAYDEDTEVKSGGVLGVLVCWPDEDNKVVLAVNKLHRRQHIGRLLMVATRPSGVYDYTAWVHTTNTPAQHFLLSRGAGPIAFNAAGGVCWQTPGFIASDGAEDGIDPMESSRARRARLRSPLAAYEEPCDYAIDRYDEDRDLEPSY